MIVALAGRPNTGKTTLFNALTGLRQRVANFAGCTVEKAVGTLETSDSIQIVDLPGTFSIVAHSEDEKVALRFLSETIEKESLSVICVAEASNLHNDLALALALKQAGYTVALAVNMIDEAEHNGIVLDAERLARETAMPVFPISARFGRGLEDLRSFLDKVPSSSAEDPIDFRSAEPRRLESIQNAAMRQAEETANRCLRLPRNRLLPTIARSIRIDRWLFHPVIGPAFLAATLFLVFEALFSLGRPMGNAIGDLSSWLSGQIRPELGGGILASLLCDGIVPGLAAVLTFVPQIAILFLLIGALEQSGYLPRAGAMLDRALRPFGLDGKVVIPFLSSFACAIPGVMAARTIADEKRRLTAVLLSPLMTCSARIPVYTLLIAAFVPVAFRPLGLNGQAVVMAAMYVFGIVMALLLALILRLTVLADNTPAPALVLPPYRLPKTKELVRYVWLRCGHFLSRAGKVIFMVSLILWALAAFPRAPRLSADANQQAALQIESSALGRLGRAVEPVFRPIGYDWKLSVAVISSLAAREVFVGTLGTLYALSTDQKGRHNLVETLSSAKTPEGRPLYGLPTAVSLLIFFAIALQCISTIAVVRRETGGWKWPAIQFTAFFLIAYSLSFAAYRLLS
jgi:ferrous iron transport protein B